MPTPSPTENDKKVDHAERTHDPDGKGAKDLLSMAAGDTTVPVSETSTTVFDEKVVNTEANQPSEVRPSRKGKEEEEETDTSVVHLPLEYIQVVRGLDEAYGLVDGEHECEVMARRIFARQAAFATFFVNATFLTCGALFFASQTDWAMEDVALFTVYTVTSAGYGHVEIPQTALFQLVDTFYVLIGLSLMAIMLAQIYKCLEMETIRIQEAAGLKAEVLQEGIDNLKMQPASEKRNKSLEKLENLKRKHFNGFARFTLFLSRVVIFSVENPWGDFVYRLVSLVGLALLGGLTVGVIEGWPWYTCIYWSVISMTTVGYGDVVPETVIGKVLTTMWLPLNMFFLSILFCSVGHYYLQFSDKQIEKLSKRLQATKRAEQVELKRKSYHQSSTMDTPDVEKGNVEQEDSTVDPIPRTSSRLIDLPMTRRFFGANLATMKDVLKIFNESNGILDSSHGEIGELEGDHPSVMMSGDTPNFYLRVKVKERVAFIVANDVAGRNSSLTTSDKAGMLSVFLGGTVDAAEKWLIPRQARRAFRAVAFEALLYVGESSLVNEGVAALHRLTPLEFHRIFSPLLVAMGDKDTLQNWLTSTDLLWEKESISKVARRSKQLSHNSLHCGHKDYAKTDDQVEFPVNPAEGFNLFGEL